MIEIVVIGGSAGALEALVALVPALPDAFTAPLVITLHLGATQRNLVPDILRNVTRRPVDDIVNYSRPSIDVLFESAADAYGPRCAGVLLSGANDDGARGLERIVATGGRAFVQVPASATHPTMPEAAMRRLGDRARVVTIPDLADALAQFGVATYREDHP